MKTSETTHLAFRPRKGVSYEMRRPSNPKESAEPKNENGRSEYLDLRDIRPEIHLHEGFMRLFIVGSITQTDAWFPVTSASSASALHGTANEREIAEMAVKFLRETQFDNPELGPSLIRSALERFGWTPCHLTTYPKEP